MNSVDVRELQPNSEKTYPTIVPLTEDLGQEDGLANAPGPRLGFECEYRGHVIVVALVWDGWKLEEISRNDELAKA